MFIRKYRTRLNRSLRLTVFLAAMAFAASGTATVPFMTIPAYAASDDEKDYTVSDAWWSDDEDRAIAEWEKAEDSTKYKVQLYRTNLSNPVGKEISTGGSSHDFSSAISQKGTGNYFFTVIPVKGGAELTVTSDTLEVDSETMSAIRASLKEKKAAASAEKLEGGPRWVMNLVHGSCVIIA